jgi:hypothetical protein
VRRPVSLTAASCAFRLLFVSVLFRGVHVLPCSGKLPKALLVLDLVCYPVQHLRLAPLLAADSFIVLRRHRSRTAAGFPSSKVHERSKRSSKAHESCGVVHCSLFIDHCSSPPIPSSMIISEVGL